MKCCVQDGNIYTICAECIYLQGDVVSQKMFIFFFFLDGWEKLVYITWPSLLFSTLKKIFC